MMKVWHDLSLVNWHVNSLVDESLASLPSVNIEQYTLADGQIAWQISFNSPTSPKISNVQLLSFTVLTLKQE